MDLYSEEAVTSFDGALSRHIVDETVGPPDVGDWSQGGANKPVTASIRVKHGDDLRHGVPVELAGLLAEFFLITE
jgi:hypothetical protein